MRKLIIVATALVIGMSASIVSASAGEKAKNVDYRAAAGKRLDALVAKKVQCYQEMGLKEGKDWMINPKNRRDVMTNDDFPANRATDAQLVEFDKCKAIGH